MKQKDEDRKKASLFRFLGSFFYFQSCVRYVRRTPTPKILLTFFSFSVPTSHHGIFTQSILNMTIVHPLHHTIPDTRTTSKGNIYYRYHQPAMPPKTKQSSKKGTAKPKRVPHANETPLKHKAPGHGAVERAKDQMWDEPSSTSSGGGGGSSSLLQKASTAPKPKYKATTTTSISSMMMGISRGGGGIGSGGSITKKKNPTTASRKTTGTTTTRSAATTIIPSSTATDNNNSNNNNTERKINPDSAFFSSSKSASKR